MSTLDAEPETRDAATWCRYIAGMIGCYLKIGVDDERVTAIAGIIERRLNWLPATTHPASDAQQPTPAAALACVKSPNELDPNRMVCAGPCTKRICTCYPKLLEQTSPELLYRGDGDLRDEIDHWQARALKAEAALSQQEPVGEVYSISAMRRDEEAYATIRLLHRASDQWCLRVRTGDKLYTSPPPAAQPAVPEGMALVPIEPTDEMLLNVDEEVGGHCYSCTRWKANYDDCRRVWASMLSAAQQQNKDQ